MYIYIYIYIYMRNPARSTMVEQGVTFEAPPEPFV